MSDMTELMKQAMDAAPPADPAGASAPPTGSDAGTTPAVGSQPTTPTAPQGSQTGAGAPSTADDLPADLKTYLEANPQHKEVVDLVSRQMQAAWTPRLQEAAQLRKMTEGLEPNVIEGIRQLQQLAAVNPQAAAAHLQQWANQLSPAQQQQVIAAAQGQPAEPQFYSETEAALWKQQQEMIAWRKGQEETAQRQHIQQFAFQANAELNKIAAEYGIDIPLEARGRAADMAMRTGISVGDAFFATNRHALVPAIQQKARDEASSVMQGKAAGAAGNPGSIVARSGASANEGRDFDSILSRVRQEMGV